MKYIKPYNESKEENIESICKEYDIRNYTINPDGSIDVDGDVHLERRYNQLFKFSKLPFRFNRVSGSFYCHNSLLTTLEGSPKEVGGNFRCYNNRLTSLEGSPKIVGLDFDCYDNKLTSLKGGPEKVGGIFYCFNNRLTSLEGSPKIIGGYYFNCSNNRLTSVRGLPEDFEGALDTSGNTVFKLFYYIGRNLKVANSKIAHLLNEYDVISLDGKKIYRDNLEEVFHVLGQEIPEDLKFDNYEIH